MAMVKTRSIEVEVVQKVLVIYAKDIAAKNLSAAASNPVRLPCV